MQIAQKRFQSGEFAEKNANETAAFFAVYFFRDPFFMHFIFTNRKRALGRMKKRSQKNVDISMKMQAALQKRANLCRTDGERGEIMCELLQNMLTVYERTPHFEDFLPKTPISGCGLYVVLDKKNRTCYYMSICKHQYTLPWGLRGAGNAFSAGNARKKAVSSGGCARAAVFPLKNKEKAK